MCDNLINALKLLANQQQDGDSPIQSIVIGLLEKSRLRIMDGLRKFVSKIVDLEKHTQSKKVVKPKIATDFPKAVVREGADELTLRAHEELPSALCTNPRMVTQDWP